MHTHAKPVSFRSCAWVTQSCTDYTSCDWTSSLVIRIANHPLTTGEIAIFQSFVLLRLQQLTFALAIPVTTFVGSNSIHTTSHHLPTSVRELHMGFSLVLIFNREHYLDDLLSKALVIILYACRRSLEVSRYVTLFKLTGQKRQGLINKVHGSSVQNKKKNLTVIQWLHCCHTVATKPGSEQWSYCILLHCSGCCGSPLSYLHLLSTYP